MDQVILTRDDGEEFYMFEGKHVVVLHSESPGYREWEIGVNHKRYAIIQEGDEWTLMYFVSDRNAWVDAPEDVETFLVRHNLILAA